jgi:Methylaspartate ammonia-lyase C-terminus
VAARAADIIHVKTPDLGGVNNTIEAMLLVTRNGFAAYCGGTCNETDRSAQARLAAQWGEATAYCPSCCGDPVMRPSLASVSLRFHGRLRGREFRNPPVPTSGA